MADQQKKNKTSKKRKPNNQAHPTRERHPDRVLRRIIRSSGYTEAERYAKKYSLTVALDRLNWFGPKKGMPGWIHDKINEAAARQLRTKGNKKAGTRTRVGRALRRREKFGAKQAPAAVLPPTLPSVA